MLNLKKQVSFYKLEQIFAKSKLLLICHCNNMNTLEWCLLKKELSKLNLLEGVNTLLVKNKIAKKLLNPLSFTSLASQEKDQTIVLDLNAGLLKKPFKVATISKTLSTQDKDNFKDTNLRSTVCETAEKVIIIPKLFQGPTFIIGCEAMELVVPLVNLINKNKKLLVVGGVLQKKIINHLDVNLLKKLDKSIFNELVGVLERPIVNFFSINQRHTTEILLLLIAKQTNLDKVSNAS